MYVYIGITIARKLPMIKPTVYFTKATPSDTSSSSSGSSTSIGDGAAAAGLKRKELHSGSGMGEEGASVKKVR